MTEHQRQATRDWSLDRWTKKVHRFVIILVIIWTSCLSTAVGGQGNGTVRFKNGDMYRGDFVSFDKSRPDDGARTATLSQENFAWTCPSFSEPLIVPWSVVETLSFSRKTKSEPRPESPKFILEFWDGECVTGEVLALTPESITLGSDRFETQTVAIESIRTMLRVVDGDSQEMGMLSPEGWRQSLPPVNPEDALKWQIKVGSIVTETAGAAIERQVIVPAVNAMEIDTAWTHSNPNWILAIGSPRHLQLHVRKLEHRNALAVTLLFEEKENADISTAIVPFEGLESMKLRILSDYIRGQFAVQLHGNTIAEIRGKEKQRGEKVQPLVFTNIAEGGIILRDARISRSVFSLVSPEQSEVGFSGGAPKVILLNSEEFIGTPTDYRQSDRTFAFEGTSRGLGRVSLMDVERIEFLPATDRSKETPPIVSKERFLVELSDGSRFTGHEIHRNDAAIHLLGRVPNQHIVCPLNEVISIYSQHTDSAPHNAMPQRTDTLGQRNAMKLRSAHAISLGTFVPHAAPAVSRNAPPGLYWLPDGLETGVPLAQDISGTIDKLARPMQSDRSLEGEPARLPSPSSNSALEQYGRTPFPGEPTLFLSSGDAIPAQLLHFKEGTLAALSSYTGGFDVPSDRIRGVRQLIYTGGDSIDPAALNRLITIPRLARRDPPTHLVVTRDGDALRCQMISFDENELRVNVRGELKTFELKNVAEIVWLELPDSRDSSGPTAPTAQSAKTAGFNHDRLGNAQIILEHGSSLRLNLQTVSEDQILGAHDVLGPCTLPFENCIRILLGDEIAEYAKVSRYARWKLRHAIDPQFVQQQAELAAIREGRSKWIGLPAPPFTLTSLQGDGVELADSLGKVVVIQFWTSWSGPSQKSLPQIVKLATEFPANEMTLITINVSEAHPLIRATLAVLGVQATVAMDRSGEVSQSYGVNAYPHTFVVDRKGLVRGVFVGGGDDLPNRVRERVAVALEEEFVDD